MVGCFFAMPPGPIGQKRPTVWPGRGQVRPDLPPELPKRVQLTFNSSGTGLTA